MHHDPSAFLWLKIRKTCAACSATSLLAQAIVSSRPPTRRQPDRADLAVPECHGRSVEFYSELARR
jgi:hypothetical protein